MRKSRKAKKTNETIQDQLANVVTPSGYIVDQVVWKYLTRCVLKGKNILLTGPSGCGKTAACTNLTDQTGRNLYKFNMGATQDPRATLIGNTHLRDGETVFDESLFVKAIQEPNAVILLDELSRAHPEAWNILMPVLDEDQRYMRLDEQVGSPTIKVHPTVSFIATANIGAEYSSTRTMDRAMMDRFEIVEMRELSKAEETGLISKRYPEVNDDTVEQIVSLSAAIREAYGNEANGLDTSISTRMVLRIAELCEDGFDIGEAIQVGLLPLFSKEGGEEASRYKVNQIVTTIVGTQGNIDDVLDFN